MKKSIGLALSGGGVKGAVHAGMIHFFDEIGLKPTLISGTSAGAIVGALYASGKSGKQIFDFFIEERPFSRSLLSGNRGLINTPELRKTLEAYDMKTVFEDLHIPLITTASNMLTGKAHYFESGELMDKVLASASFPGLFSPMEIEGVLYSDGGILNNFPVDLIHKKTDIVIGMHLSPNKQLTLGNLSSTTDILSRTVDIQGSEAEYNKLELCDIGMCPPELMNYNTFDFKKEKMQQLFDLGYTYTKSYEAQLTQMVRENES